MFIQYGIIPPKKVIKYLLSSVWVHPPPSTNNSLRMERSGRGRREGGGGGFLFTFRFWFKMRHHPCFSIVLSVTTLIFLSSSRKHSWWSLDIKCREILAFGWIHFYLLNTVYLLGKEIQIQIESQTTKSDEILRPWREREGRGGGVTLYFNCLKVSPSSGRCWVLTADSLNH